MSEKVIPLIPKQTIKTRVEKQLERQAEEQRRKLLKNRVQIAKEGATFYQKKFYSEACKKYYQYLYILEVWKKCKKNELHPSLFDTKKDIYELVLIAGVYWDLVRLYDRAKRNDQKEELKNCLRFYILFSKGMPFQKFSAQSLRKYLQGGKCKHTLEFKNAYKELAGDKCFVITSLLDVIEFETLDFYRNYRDQVMSKSRSGRAAIKLYYFIGPTLAKSVGRFPKPIRLLLARTIEFFVPLSKDETQH